MKKIILNLSAFFLFLPALAAIRKVPLQYATIQAALNACGAGDMVVVANGTYYEQLVWPNVLNVTLKSKSDNPDSVNVDGNNSNPAVLLTISGSGLLDKNALISGITFRNGGRGADIILSKATFKNCNFSNNKIGYFSSSGAGMNCSNADVYVENCNYYNNTVCACSTYTASGIALNISGGSVTIKEGSFTGNFMGTGTTYGTIKVSSAKLKLSRVIIRENTVSYTFQFLKAAGGLSFPLGMALYSEYADVSITNSLIANNTANVLIYTGTAVDTALGASVYFYGASNSLSIQNSTIAGNKIIETFLPNKKCYAKGNAVYASLNNKISNSIFWNNDNEGLEFFTIADNSNNNTDISYTDLRTAYTGTGNISESPKFLTNTDFHLKNNSPCIDAGNANAATPATDLDKYPRIVPTGNRDLDMGCYELQQISKSSELIQGIVAANPSINIYPNPSNGKIKLQLSNETINSWLKVYNLNGKIVYSKFITSASGEVNMNKLVNGMYLMQLIKNEKTVASQKIMIGK